MSEIPGAGSGDAGGAGIPPPYGSPAPPPNPPGRLDRILVDTVPRGLLAALLLPFAGFVIGTACVFLGPVGQFLCAAFGLAPGVAQLLYVIPLDRWAAHRSRSRFRKGLWIGAAVVFLLNSACWGTAMVLLGNANFR